ncbi:hypothetical protein F3K32_25775 [Streptomyces sp. LBUM 1483]|nr:hypothetical protein [Streptomyces sp. LBUM 1481]MBP5923587.1 hypothetical protein [Streptomyces sp. LBUM 1483]
MATRTSWRSSWSWAPRSSCRARRWARTPPWRSRGAAPLLQGRGAVTSAAPPRGAAGHAGPAAAHARWGRHLENQVPPPSGVPRAPHHPRKDGGRGYLPLAASLSLLPAETFTL